MPRSQEFPHSMLATFSSEQWVRLADLAEERRWPKTEVLRWLVEGSGLSTSTDVGATTPPGGVAGGGGGTEEPGSRRVPSPTLESDMRPADRSRPPTRGTAIDSSPSDPPSGSSEIGSGKSSGPPGPASSPARPSREVPFNPKDKWK